MKFCIFVSNNSHWETPFFYFHISKQCQILLFMLSVCKTPHNPCGSINSCRPRTADVLSDIMFACITVCLLPWWWGWWWWPFCLHEKPPDCLNCVCSFLGVIHIHILQFYVGRAHKLSKYVYLYDSFVFITFVEVKYLEQNLIAFKYLNCMQNILRLNLKTNKLLVKVINLIWTRWS